jgi:hypothetical protein
LEMVKASKWCTSSEKIFVFFLFYVGGRTSELQTLFTSEIVGKCCNTLCGFYKVERGRGPIVLKKWTCQFRKVSKNKHKVHFTC